MPYGSADFMSEPVMFSSCGGVDAAHVPLVILTHKHSGIINSLSSFHFSHFVHKFINNEDIYTPSETSTDPHCQTPNPPFPVAFLNKALLKMIQLNHRRGIHQEAHNSQKSKKSSKLPLTAIYPLSPMRIPKTHHFNLGRVVNYTSLSSFLFLFGEIQKLLWQSFRFGSTRILFVFIFLSLTPSALCLTKKKKNSQVIIYRKHVSSIALGSSKDSSLDPLRTEERMNLS